MSFIVRLYKDFEKRVNSTKVPTNLVGTFTDFNINLKSPTNLYSPVITIDDVSFRDQYDNITNPLEYNYAYILDFKRYYFIRNWSWQNGIWAASLEIDVLASHKTSIGNTSVNVLRSSSACDPDLIDSKYLTISTCLTDFNTQSSIWHTNLNSTSASDGFFVLGIVNNDSGAVGATSYYAASGRDTRAFISQLYASPSWMNITDASISNDLQKMLMNPIQYVISCMWFPLSLNYTGLTTVTNVPVGWWSVSLPSGCVFYKLTNSALQWDEPLTMQIPKHPGASDPNMSWLQNAPYSTYQMQFYPYGVFELDASKLYGYDKVYFVQKIDFMTGQGTLQVYRKDGPSLDGIIYVATAQVGIPISVAQMSVDMSRIGNTSTWVLGAGLGIASDTEATQDLIDYAGLFYDTAVKGFGSLGSQYVTNVIDYVGSGFEGQAPRLFNENYKSGTAAAGKHLLSAAGRVAANIANAVLASSGVCTLMGNNGTLAQYYLDQIITLFYFNITDTDPTHYGYPLNKVRTISALPGFLLCANDGDLSISGSADERQTIVAAMTGGFYYE